MAAAAGRAGAGLLGWLPFINPLKLPPRSRLWTFLPLAFCIALVYRATRSVSVQELPRATLITFVNIVVGMVVIAATAYGVHAAVLRWAA